MRYAMIMAGGAGTRLWPMSRRNRPKQLLPFIGSRSLLEIAASRLDGVVSHDHCFICTSEAFREAIRDALPAFVDERILGEPTPRDTVNAVGLTAALLASRDAQAVFAVLTADHIIEPQEEFVRKLDLGFRLAESQSSCFVTFSITPTFPATGYGYVERGDVIAGFEGAFRSKRFVEKPDLATAQRYVASGNFGWNSGMFVFPAATFMRALEWWLPENHAGLLDIAGAWDQGIDKRRITMERVYPNLKKISVDYGIMEPASKDPQQRIPICTVPMNVRWMDVGSWVTYGETLAPLDTSNNRANCHTAHLGSRNVLAVSDDPDHTIAALDCEDLIIVRTADATLVCPRSSAERIKHVAESVDDRLR